LEVLSIHEDAESRNERLEKVKGKW